MHDERSYQNLSNRCSHFFKNAHKIKKKLQENLMRKSRKKKLFLLIPAKKISKTLMASNDDLKANIDNIFKSLHQSNVYFTVHLLLQHENSVLVVYLKSNKHNFYIVVHLICHIP